eukprot:6812999-Lingulodinium_polyedra.AAC.1
MKLKASFCARAEGISRGIAWGNRSVYGRESGAGRLKFQRESKFLLELLKKAESTRPLRRIEVPP